VGNVSESTSTMLERLDAMQNELNALFESLRTGSNRLTADLQLLERNLEEVRDAVAPRPRFEPEPTAAHATQRPPQPEVPAPATPSQPQLHDPAGATAAGAGAPAGGAPVGAAGTTTAAAALPPREPTSPASATPTSPPPTPAAQAGGGNGAPLEPDPGTRPHGDVLAEPGAGAEGAAGGGGSEDTESARLVALNMAMDRKPREETERVLAEQFRLADLRGLVDEVYASFES
jgi:hypothetical protein